MASQSFQPDSVENPDSESDDRRESLGKGQTQSVSATGGAEMTSWVLPSDGALEGGDWCEIIVHSNDEVFLSVGDVQGHGAVAAPHMERVRRSIVEASVVVRDPSEILAVANTVASESGDERLVTAIVARFDTRTRLLTFASAGHPPPLLLAGDRHAYLEAARADVPLGFDARSSASNSSVDIPAGAMTVFYTDGVTERDRDVLRGEAELVEAARITYDEPTEIDARAIAQHVFRDGFSHDDAATMTLRSS